MRRPCIQAAFWRSTAVEWLFHYCEIAVSQLWNSYSTVMEQQKAA